MKPATSRARAVWAMAGTYIFSRRAGQRLVLVWQGPLAEAVAQLESAHNLERAPLIHADVFPAPEGGILFFSSRGGPHEPLVRHTSPPPASWTAQKRA